MHETQDIVRGGAGLGDAHAAVILLHGRGATAQSILRLADELVQSGVAYLAPQAARRTWYPYSFMAPTDQNEPALSSALSRVGTLLATTSEAGIPADRVALLGFSQGACLALEYAARHPQRYGALVGWSGGLIGPEDDPLAHDGSLEGTPVFLGCSDQDPHIPLERVRDTADVLDAMGAQVDLRVYPGMGHTVNDDEIRAVRDLIAGLVPGATPRPSAPPAEDGEAEDEGDGDESDDWAYEDDT